MFENDLLGRSQPRHREYADSVGDSDTETYATAAHLSEGTGGLAEVFISYARQDQVVATRVAKALRAAGYDVWWDADLPAHDAYSEVIERNLEQARAVVVLWSATASKSQWVRAEADFARNASKLVQAQVDGSMPPMPFNQIQCADLARWKGNTSHPGWSKLQASVAVLLSSEDRPAPKSVPPRLRDRVQPRHWWVAAALAFVVAAGVMFFQFVSPAENHKPVLAVLPFRTLDSHDDSLVAGMWEDTRQAIGRNPQLVVLGPNSAEELAKKGEDASRKAADYLLHASVRSAGDRIRVSADLVRTNDGVQVWNQDFDRKLDDVFALQSEIASEIEGRIRGRLAKKGGVIPENIATTGDLYALYSDARAKIRKRDISLLTSAHAELQQVVKADPNFAPAWAALSNLEARFLPHLNNWDLTNHHSVEFARKAIDLAPNLAAGHAALALALNLKGPVARAEIERAVKLDPNDYEAVHWLGILQDDAGDKKSALGSFTRAAKIEPLFWPAVLARYQGLKDLGDTAGIQQLIEEERQIGADYFVASIRIDSAVAKGNLAEAANTGLQHWASGKQDGRDVIGLRLWLVLMQLGFLDEAFKVGPAPDFSPYLMRNDPKGLDMIEGQHIPTSAFFSLQPLTENAGRVYLLSGRSKKLAEMYLSLKSSPEAFVKLATGDGPEHFLYSAPLIAVALKQNGHTQDANALISVAETKAKGLDITKPLNAVLLARIYAAQGRKADALPLLAGAVARGWLPQPPELQVDLYFDLPLAGLKGEPKFEAARQQILGTVARERAQVNLRLVRLLSNGEAVAQR